MFIKTHIYETGKKIYRIGEDIFNIHGLQRACILYIYMYIDIDIRCRHWYNSIINKGKANNQIEIARNTNTSQKGIWK